MKRAMIKKFNTHENYFGEFHTVGKQENIACPITKITRK